MRILVITNSFPSASETFVANHIDGLVRKGHDVTVLAKRPEKGGSPSLSENESIKVVYCSTRNRRLAGLASVWAGLRYGVVHPIRFARIAAQILTHRDLAVSQTFAAERLLSGERFDVTHAEFGPLGNIALALRECGIETGPICTSFRGADISSYAARKPYAYALLSGQGDAFLPVCAAFVPRLLALGFHAERIHVYHSAVALEEFPFRPFHGRSSGRLRLLGVGRFVAKKGFIHAVEVLARLREDGLDAELTLVGDGIERRALIERAQTLGVAASLRLTGWLDRAGVASRLKEADVFIGTSLTPSSGELEGIPNVLKEAMAVGLPVVAFDHSGVGELVIEGETGRLVPTGDVQALAAVIHAIVDDPATTNRMVNAARKLIESSYELEALAAEAERIYFDLIERAPDRRDRSADRKMSGS